MADPDGSSQSRAGTHELETSEVRTGGGVGGRVPCIEVILADILIVLDEVLLIEISNLARQLKFSPTI